MCGVFGFISNENRPVDLKTLRTIARVTETRGRHAFGFAWVDRCGRMKAFRQKGRITDHLGLLAMAVDATMLIGHCRFATQGDPDDNTNNHPHRSDRGYIVHNGMIRDFVEIARTHRLPLQTDCDSEVLALLIERFSGSMIHRCCRSVDQVDAAAPLVMLGLWSRPRRLIAIRRGNPLCTSETSEGIYLASLAEGMPGHAASMINGQGVEFRLDRSRRPVREGFSVTGKDRLAVIAETERESHLELFARDLGDL